MKGNVNKNHKKHQNKKQNTSEKLNAGVPDSAEKSSLPEGNVNKQTGEKEAVEAAAPVKEKEAVEAAGPVKEKEAVEAAGPAEEKEAVEAAGPAEEKEAVEAAGPEEEKEAVEAAAPAREQEPPEETAEKEAPETAAPEEKEVPEEESEEASAENDIEQYEEESDFLVEPWEEWDDEDDQEAQPAKPWAMLLVFLGLIAVAAVICVVLWKSTHTGEPGEDPHSVFSDTALPAGDGSSQAYQPSDSATAPPEAEQTPDPDRVVTQEGRTIIFTKCDDLVSPKEYVNLRTEPSTSQGNATVSCRLNYGETAHRTGYSDDMGWSRVEYNDQVLYVVTSYVFVVTDTAE